MSGKTDLQPLVYSCMHPSDSLFRSNVDPIVWIKLPTYVGGLFPVEIFKHDILE